MHSPLRSLIAASRWGAILALLHGCDSNPNAPNQLPLAPEPECSGPTYGGGFGYHGQCCQEVLCMAAVDGICPDAATAHPPGYPPGSGSCSCGTPEGPFDGTANGDDAACCYLIGSIGCDGRPLVVDREVRAAELVRSDEWRAMGIAAPAGGDREGLAAAWAARGLMEHASIASFARWSLELLALGAPSELVRGAHAAAGEEIAHARSCFGFASSYLGEAVGPGRLDVGGAMVPRLLREVAHATVVEACVGETLAAMELLEAAATCTDTEIQGTLLAIADDETRHAELAWSFLRWAIARDPSLRRELLTTFEAALAAALVEVDGSDDLPEGMGFVSRNARHALRRIAAREILVPAARAMLGSRPDDAGRLSCA